MAFHPQYAPDFKIKIKGQLLPPALRAAVMSVRFENAAKEMDRVEVQIFDPKLQWLENPLFKTYRELSLAIGYAGNLKEVFVGEITGKQASFSGGASTITIEASDRGHRLMGGTKERSFGSLPDTAIIAFVAIENGLIPSVNVGSAAALAALAILLGKPRFQQNKSDYEFLKEMAVASGVQFQVENRTLYLKAFSDIAPAVNLTWGRDLVDFSPRFSVVGQVDAVAVKIWLREMKLSFVITVGWDFKSNRFKLKVVPGAAAKDDEGNTGGKEGDEAGSGATLKFVDQPIKDPTDVAKVLIKAFSELKSKLNSRLTGSGTAVGNPDLRAGMVMRLDGIGAAFSGNYRLNSTTHELDSSGYKTNFNLYREVIPEVFA